METDECAPVVIIGAGPTGLMAACQLLRFGVNFMIIDSKPGPTTESRAMVVTPRSMEIYQQMGLAGRIVKDGKIIPDLSIYSNGIKKATFNLSNTGEYFTAFPYLQGYEQYKNEELLYSRLRSAKTDVLWNTRFVALEQHPGHIMVTVSLNGQVRQLKATYVLGCDGASSPVRHTLKLDFSGRTYDSKFFVADVILDAVDLPGKLMAFPSRSNFCAFFPLPGLNRYRLLGTLPTSFRTQDDITFGDVLPIVKAIVKINFDVEKVNWFSVYQLHQRVAKRFDVGSCFLLGDAAHVHSPAGGQGMNTGLQDAHNLAWKIAMVVKGTAGKRLLETYHEERRPFAKWLLKFTDRLFAFMTSNSLLIYWCRRFMLSFILDVILSIGIVRTRFFLVLAQLSYTYARSILSVNFSRQKLKFGAGSRCPYIKIQVDNTRVGTFDLLTAPCFHLLCIGENKINKDEASHLSKLDVKIIYLPLTLEWKALGVTDQLYILVRPDQFIGMLSDTYATKQAQNYFKRMNE